MVDRACLRPYDRTRTAVCFERKRARTHQRSGICSGKGRRRKEKNLKPRKYEKREKEREKEKENRETNKLRFFGTLLTEAEKEYVVRQIGELPLVLGGAEGGWLCVCVCTVIALRSRVLAFFWEFAKYGSMKVKE